MAFFLIPIKSIKSFNFRRLLQIIFFVLIALISINHTLSERGIAIPLLSSASLHALCPYGGVETFVSLITSGVMVKKVHESAVALLAIILFLSVIFGPVFCSYVCPLGSIQEWLSKLGKKLFPKKFNRFVPKKPDKWLRYIRYIILIWTVYLSTMSLKLVFEAYDPYYALFSFWTGDVAVTSLLVLGLVLISSLFIERAWCKYACPFGALLGLTNFFKVFKIRRNTETCTSCNLCTKNCPMNIDVANKEVVMDHQCISCGECTSEKFCPENNTVTLSTKSRKHVSTKIVAISIVVVLIVGIGIAKLTDTFKTESTKTPAKIEAGEFAGEYDPSDIRGSYSLGDISEAFDVAVETLADAFGIDEEDNSAYQVKNLEVIYDDVGTGSVRQFVALYTGLPFSDEFEGLPLTAIEVLYSENKISQEEYETLKAQHIVSDQQSPTEEKTSNADGAVSEEEHPAIGGETTVRDAMDLGISLDSIEAILQTDLSDESMLIKDIAKDSGLKFSEVKDELNSIIE